MKYFLSFFLFCAAFFCVGQHTASIKGEVKGIPVDEIVLLSLYGDNVQAIDTLSAVGGRFMFTPSPTLDYGLIRLDIGKRNYIDLIYDGKPVDFVVESNDPVAQMEIIESDENKHWYDYRKTRERFDRRLTVLGNALSYYPDDDPFYLTLQEEYFTILEQQELFLETMSMVGTETMAGFLIRCDIMPAVPNELAPEAQLAWVKDHFYDNIDFSDVRILYSDILPRKIIEYLKLYANRNLSREDLEKEYMKSVDRIMRCVGGKNDEVEEMVINHLIKGFQQLEFQEVLTYIVNQYVLESSCVDEERKASLEQRIEGFDKMAIGKTVPEFSIPTTHNEVITNATDTPYRLIMFWASWCPHCLTDMPNIIETLNKVDRAKLEVILVSVDEVKEEWEAANENHPGWWKESCDFKGWNGDMANDFYIYATPTILLLDKNGKILSKPLNSGQLRLALQQERLLP